LSFYKLSSRAFIREHGGTPELLADLGLEGPDKLIFMDRLCEIHDAVLEIRAAAERRARGEG
jgi:hypothetical protein